MSDRNMTIEAWELVDRLDYIEGQLRALFEDRYVPFSQATANKMPTEVLELARAGKKVAAIQAYMKYAGVGIQEAKSVVDSL